MSRFFVALATLARCATRWTTWWRRGRASAATSTWPPSPSSAGSAGSPAASTWPAVPAFSSHGVESWEFDVLAALRRAGAPYELSPGRLLRETLVTSGTMTNRVDRLVGRGLVQRFPDPADRRGVLVRLTPEGKATVDGAFEALLDAERDLLADLSDRPHRPDGSSPTSGPRRIPDVSSVSAGCIRQGLRSHRSAASSHSSSTASFSARTASSSAPSSVRRTWSAACSASAGVELGLAGRGAARAACRGGRASCGPRAPRRCRPWSARPRRPRADCVAVRASRRLVDLSPRPPASARGTRRRRRGASRSGRRRAAPRPSR